MWAEVYPLVRDRVRIQTADSKAHSLPRMIYHRIPSNSYLICDTASLLPFMQLNAASTFYERTEYYVLSIMTCVTHTYTHYSIECCTYKPYILYRVKFRDFFKMWFSSYALILFSSKRSRWLQCSEFYMALFSSSLILLAPSDLPLNPFIALLIMIIAFFISRISIDNF